MMISPGRATASLGPRAFDTDERHGSTQNGTETACPVVGLLGRAGWFRVGQNGVAQTDWRPKMGLYV
jgi:hypothetical protein